MGSRAAFAGLRVLPRAQGPREIRRDARLRRQPPPGQGTGERQRDDQHRHVLLQDQERTPEAVIIRKSLRIRPWPFPSSSKCICSRQDKFYKRKFLVSSKFLVSNVKYMNMCKKR